MTNANHCWYSVHSIDSFNVSNKERIHSLFIFLQELLGSSGRAQKKSLLQMYTGKFWQIIQWFFCAAACSLKNSVSGWKTLGSSHWCFVVGELQKQECLFTCSMFLLCSWCYQDTTIVMYMWPTGIFLKPSHDALTFFFPPSLSTLL